MSSGRTRLSGRWCDAKRPKLSTSRPSWATTAYRQRSRNQSARVVPRLLFACKVRRRFVVGCTVWCQVLNMYLRNFNLAFLHRVYQSINGSECSPLGVWTPQVFRLFQDYRCIFVVLSWVLFRPIHLLLSPSRNTSSSFADKAFLSLWVHYTFNP